MKASFKVSYYLSNEFDYKKYNRIHELKIFSLNKGDNIYLAENLKDKSVIILDCKTLSTKMEFDNNVYLIHVMVFSNKNERRYYLNYLKKKE